MAIAKKSLQTLAAHMLVFAQGLVLTPIVIKVVGTESYGGYVLITTYLGVVVGVSSLGVGISAKRWLPSSEERARRAELFFPQFTFQISMVLVLAALSMAAYELGRRTGGFSLPGFSVWLIPAYLGTYVLWGQPTDYFRYTHRTGIYNVATVIPCYLFILLALLIYYFVGILNPGSLIFSMTVAFLLVALPEWWKLYGEIGIRFRLQKLSEIGAEIRLGFPIVLSYIVDMILAGGDRYIIAAMMSVRDVGKYAPAYALGSLVIVLPKVFGVVLPQYLSHCVDTGDVAGAKRILSGAVRVFLLVSIPFVVGSLVLGKAVLRLYANEEVAEAAWLVIPLVAIGSVFYGMVLITGNLLFVRLNTGSMFRINAAASVLNVVLNVVLLRLFPNVVMAALATLLSYLISYIWLNYLILGDEVAPTIEAGWLFRVCAAAALMGGVVHVAANAVSNQIVAKIGMGLLAGCVVYVTALFVFGAAEDEFGMLRKWKATA